MGRRHTGALRVPLLLWTALVGAVLPGGEAFADTWYPAPGCAHKIREGSTQTEVRDNCGDPDSSYVDTRVVRTGRKASDRAYFVPGYAKDGVRTIVIRERPPADPTIVNYDVWVYDLGANCKHCSSWSLRVFFREGRVVEAGKVRDEGR